MPSKLAVFSSPVRSAHSSPSPSPMSTTPNNSPKSRKRWSLLSVFHEGKGSPRPKSALSNRSPEISPQRGRAHSSNPRSEPRLLNNNRRPTPEQLPRCDPAAEIEWGDGGPRLTLPIKVKRNIDHGPRGPSITAQVKPREPGSCN
eukprot:Selendium_serpulae@DN5377_c0_g1_i1.p1